MREEQLGVSGHANAVVTEAVEEDHGVTVAAMRMDRPSLESDDVWGCDGNIVEVGLQVTRNLAHGGFVSGGQRAPGGVQSAASYIYSRYQTACEVEGDEEQEATESFGGAHWLEGVYGETEAIVPRGARGLWV